MKKLTSILLSLILMSLVFTACGQGQTLEVMTKEKAEQQTKEFANMFIQGDFKTILDSMNASMKTQLSQEKLKLGWEQTVKDVGTLSQDITVETSESDSSVTAVATIKGENSNVKMTVAYQANDSKISGVWLKLANKEIEIEANDKYIEKEIEVGEYKLTGVITEIKEVTNPPIIIMIQGSGASDYNETILANAPFKDISAGLAQQNIATLRFNKRYFEKPELGLDASKITIFDEYINDVYAAIELAQEMGYDKIYLLGHSLGGMSVPKIAQDMPIVKGIISMAGTPRGLEEIILAQNKTSIAAMDTTDAQKKVLEKQVLDMYEQVKQLEKDDGSSPLGVAAAYWLSLKELDTLNISKNLSIPMLIMQGEEDFQVNIKDDFEYWKTQLQGKENATFISYPKLSHIFIQGGQRDKIDLEVYGIAGKVDEKVISDIATWIEQVSK